MNLTVYQPTSVTPDAFVSYWSAVYPEQDDVDLYSPHIGSLSPEALHHLFRWKFGARFAVATRRSVDTQVIPRLAELKGLPEDCDACAFLRLFSQGGAIFRIFLLHCWRPKRFPIYDQHVHRAMGAIESGHCEEMEGWPDGRKITSYLESYIPFHRMFAASDQRLVDRALWAFGRFIKASRLPGGCRASRKPKA